jgi:RHS repeat-associated protein
VALKLSNPPATLMPTVTYSEDVDANVQSVALLFCRDDSSGLSYYGARYLAPWLTRWISPDAAGAIDGLNLYVYVGNNPLKYIDPIGHFPLSLCQR